LGPRGAAGFLTKLPKNRKADGGTLKKKEGQPGIATRGKTNANSEQPFKAPAKEGGGEGEGEAVLGPTGRAQVKPWKRR